MSSQSDPQLLNKIRRWDDIRRNQFGVALTTFTALATGGIGYCAKLIADEKVHFSCWASFCFLIAAGAFGIGLLVGVFTTWTRLRDARLTAYKHNRNNEGASADELNWITARFEFWGNVTWLLFNTLVLCVSIGIISITFCIGTLYGDKLFCDHSGIATVSGISAASSATPTIQTNAAKMPSAVLNH